MTYAQTIAWMFDRLPMYQNQGASAFRKDLHNIRQLCEYLNHPEQKLRCIHVAGTNGKGSTCHMLASVLQESGFKTGLFTSPHLKDYRERIRIDGQTIPEDFVVAFIEKHKAFFEETDMSFFEMSVGLALVFFLEAGTDIAVIETGLGGRLDATNVVLPEVSVITNIGFDHTQYLGNTLEAIATEKAGIIKPSTPVVIGQTTPETRSVFTEKAHLNQSPIIFSEDKKRPDFPSDLKGSYQYFNKQTVLATLEVLQQKGFAISDEAIRTGLMKVSANTGLVGRWQQLGEKPTIIADTAHNSHGLKPVMEQLLSLPHQRLHFVLGFVNDKDLDEVLPVFPAGAIFYFCKPSVERGLDTGILQEKAAKYGLVGKIYPSVATAFQAAKNTSTAEDLIYIGGSTFVVAEIL